MLFEPDEVHRPPALPVSLVPTDHQRDVLGHRTVDPSPPSMVPPPPLVPLVPIAPIAPIAPPLVPGLPDTGEPRAKMTRHVLPDPAPFSPTGPLVAGIQVQDPHVSVPRWALLALAVLAQVALALLIKSNPWVGTAQAASILGLGIYATLRHNLVLLTCLCGYLTGSEVLWRQTDAPLFFLAAPYLLTMLSGFVVAVVLGRLGRDARLALFYVVLLIPSIVNTVRTAGGGSRELVAFALSGPLALAAFVAFTSQVVATPAAYRRILWTTLISAIGPLTVAVSEIRSALGAQGSIEFTEQSNFVTSGGFGPVQVSTVLGLAVLISVVLTILEPNRSVKILTVSLAVAFTVQSLLTFSRGGMFAVAIALSTLAIAHAREPRIRKRVMAIVVLVLALGYFVIVPWLTGFTSGAFEERFSDTTTGRTELAANDVRIFADHLLFGVGPGMTKYQRLTYNICELRSDHCSDEASSHTEFTRMLSEHGLVGLVAIGALALLAVRGVRDAARERPFAATFIAWSVAQMFYANLRVVAVPFAFGIAFLTIRPPSVPTEESDDSGDARDSEHASEYEDSGVNAEYEDSEDARDSEGASEYEDSGVAADVLGPAASNSPSTP